MESFTTGESVTIADIYAEHRWPAFTSAAIEQGFQSMHAFPMRLRGQTIGAMGLFRVTIGQLSESDAAVAQALADVATIGILHERASRDSAMLADQLQQALNSRVFIEQAKGVVAAQTGADMNTAYAIIRDYARSNRLKLSSVAQEVTERTLTLPVATRIAAP